MVNIFIVIPTDTDHRSCLKPLYGVMYVWSQPETVIQATPKTMLQCGNSYMELL